MCSQEVPASPLTTVLWKRTQLQFAGYRMVRSLRESWMECAKLEQTLLAQCLDCRVPSIDTSRPSTAREGLSHTAGCGNGDRKRRNPVLENAGKRQDRPERNRRRLARRLIGV
jgi:hypothetical protein